MIIRPIVLASLLPNFLLLASLVASQTALAQPAASQASGSPIDWRPFVEQITINGRPSSVQRAVIKLDAEQVIQNLQRQWYSDQLPVKINQSGQWTIVSRIFEGQLESAQIRTLSNGVSEVLKHKTSLAPTAEQTGSFDLPPRWITSDFTVTFTTKSVDQGQTATSYLLATSLTPDAALARITESLKAYGFVAHPTANQSIKDQLPSQGLQIVMATRSGAHATVQAMASNGKTSILVFYKS